jgi:hypothetical protein
MTVWYGAAIKVVPKVYSVPAALVDAPVRGRAGVTFGEQTRPTAGILAARPASTLQEGKKWGFMGALQSRGMDWLPPAWEPAVSLAYDGWLRREYNMI